MVSRNGSPPSQSSPIKGEEVMQRSVCAGTTVGVGRRANGQTGLEGEDEEDGDDGEGECAEVADG